MLGSGLKLVIRGVQCHCYIHLRNFTKRPVNPIELWVLGFFCEATQIQFQRLQNQYLYWQGSFYAPSLDYTYRYQNKCKRTTIMPQCKHPKKSIELVLWPQEWKKGRCFSFFAPMSLQTCVLVSGRYWFNRNRIYKNIQEEKNEEYYINFYVIYLPSL